MSKTPGHPKAELTLAEHPLRQVERVHLLGNISVTTPAIRRLLGQGGELIFWAATAVYARLVGGCTRTPRCAARNCPAERAQFALALAQRIVVGKLRTSVFCCSGTRAAALMNCRRCWKAWRPTKRNLPAPATCIR